MKTQKDFYEKQEQLSQEAMLFAQNNATDPVEQAELMVNYYEEHTFHTDQISEDQSKKFLFFEHELEAIRFVAATSGDLECARHQMKEYLSMYGRCGPLTIGETSETIKQMEEKYGVELPQQVYKKIYEDVIKAVSSSGYFDRERTEAERQESIAAIFTAYTKKPSLSAQIQDANKRAVGQKTDMPPIFLFKEDKSGDRMGKPGDANNVYYAHWLEFYSFGPDGNPRSEGSALNFKERDTHKSVPGGNGISETDVIEAFRKANPDRNVVVLSLEPSQKDLRVGAAAAVSAYEKNGKAVMSLPAYNEKTKQTQAER